MDNKIDEALYGITHNPDHVVVPNWSREAAGFPKISKGTIGEKMMNREYNGLGTLDGLRIGRINDLIDEIITYMDEGDTITITGVADREFDVVINSTRIQKPKVKVDDIDIIKSGDGNTVAVELPDGRIVSVVDPEYNNPNKSFRFVGGTNEEKD